MSYSHANTISRDEALQEASRRIAAFTGAEHELAAAEAALATAETQLATAVNNRNQIRAAIDTLRSRLRQFRQEMTEAVIRAKSYEPPVDTSLARTSLADMRPQPGGTLDQARQAAFAPNAAAASADKYYLELTKWQINGKVGAPPEMPAHMRPEQQTPAAPAIETENSK